MKTTNKVLLLSVLVLSSCNMFRHHAPNNEDRVIADGGYILHKVEKGETPRCLAKEYKISVEEVFTLNPTLDKTDPKQKLTPGQTVKILYIKR